jgi:hypothetical protein
MLACVLVWIKMDIVNKLNNISPPRYLLKRLCVFHERISLSGHYLQQRNQVLSMRRVQCGGGYMQSYLNSIIYIHF